MTTHSSFYSLSIDLYCALVLECWIDKSVSPAVGHKLAGLLSLSGPALLTTHEFSIVSIIFFDTPTPNTFKETVDNYYTKDQDTLSNLGQYQARNVKNMLGDHHY